MADFTALKTAIQNAIKQNGNEEITGNLLQEVLLAIVTTLGDGSINELITALGTEATTRSQADTTLQQNINAEAQARQLGDSTLQGGINSAMQAINAINNAIGNGCVYAGIATPSTTPAAGKVFYLALTAGTYTNFNGLEVSQGINILKNNGSTWSLDSFVGIDDAPAPSSQKLVKSGGVFDEVMKNGSAFDLSAYNGGATYADLNAALTALNALPAAYKRGGMSMKFVLSSDNKYVRYNLLAQSFTTDTTQWAVDDNGVYVENPKFIYVKTDAEGKILLAIKTDGTKVIGGDLNIGGSASISGNIRVLGNMEVSGVSYKVIENSEYIAAWVDAEDKVIFGFKSDGKTYVGDADFFNDIKANQEALAIIGGKVDSLDIDVLSSITAVENPEFVEVKTDSEGKILAGRTPDGAAFENVGFTTPKVSIDGYTIENIEGLEERIEILLDSEGKIISYRKADGTKVENVGIKTNLIELTKNGVDNLKRDLGITSSGVQQLKDYNLPKYGSVQMLKELTYSDGTNNYAPKNISKVGDRYYVTSTLVDGQVVPASVEITIIESDIDLSQWPVNKDTKHYLKTSIDFGEYLSGTYYIETKYQGNSTINYPKKNFRFTFYKDILFSKKLKIQIGELIPTSKYNLKAYWRDSSLLREHACYRMVQAIRETHSYDEQYPWNESAGGVPNATGITNGFPVKVEVSGNFQGVYWFGLAKDIDNFMLDDETMNGLLLQGDGGYGPTFWQVLEPRYWSDLLADIDNGISEDSLPHIQGWYDYLNGNTFSRETAPAHFNIKNWVDCVIILQTFGAIDMTSSNIILYAGADKTIMSPMYYDMDWTWGFLCAWNLSTFSNGQTQDQSLWVKVQEILRDEIKERYQELRTKIINMDYITRLLVSLGRQIPYTDYEKEIEKWPDEPFRPDDEWGREGTISSILAWMEKRIEFMDEYFRYENN